MQHAVLALIALPLDENKSAENLQRQLSAKLEEFGLVEEQMPLVTDEGSNLIGLGRK
jgi:hypothetical protein